MKKYVAFCLTIATALTLATSATPNCQAESLPSGTSTTVSAYENTVLTKYGYIKGETKNGVRKFLGVPFAKPPLGDLRFKAPQPPEKWGGILNCLHCKNMPMQPIVYASPGKEVQFICNDGTKNFPCEDCLYLDVFAPQNAKNAPVLVWIHGGAWTHNTASNSLNDGSSFARDGIIVVSIEYRLGAWGFISHPEIADGATIGLLDQIQALKWVHDNIEAFGGDPNRVTVGGVSAGSFCASSLVLSPLAKGLFQQAITESGNVLSTACWGNFGDNSIASVQKRTQEIMRRADCKTAEELVKCPAERLVEAASFETDMTKCIDAKNNVGIVADGNVVPKRPVNAMHEGKYNPIKLLCGYNRDEATLFFKNVTLEQYNNYIDKVFGDKAQEIKDHFPTDESNVRQRFIDILKYTFFASGIVTMADQVAKDGKDAYFYSFHFVDEGAKNTPLEVAGAAHTFEVSYVFKTLPDKFLEHPRTVKMTDCMHKYWANFIKTGSPNGEGLPIWQSYQGNGKNCMILDENPTMASIPNYDDVRFVAERMTEK